MFVSTHPGKNIIFLTEGDFVNGRLCINILLRNTFDDLRMNKIHIDW